jgi:hypothetical protein
MQRAPHWTEEEFRQLLANEHLSVETLANLLGRSPGAVTWVRAGVDSWRRGEDPHGILSRMMLRVLSREAWRGTF